MNRMSSLIYRAYIVPFYRVLHENLLELKSKLKKNSLLAIYLIIVCFTLNNCLHLYSISQILVFYIVLCVSVVMWFSPFPIYLSCAYFLSVTYDCINTIIIIINQYISWQALFWSYNTKNNNKLFLIILNYHILSYILFSFKLNAAVPK